MKKTRILALSLVVMVMLMGAGYAAWTDQLNINTTVGTGKLNVDFTAASLVAVQNEAPKENYQVFEQPNISETKKDVTLKVDNMYPGQGIKFSATFINNGTIPAVIDGINVINVGIEAPTYNGKTLSLMEAPEKALIDVTGFVKFAGESYNIPAGTTLDSLGSILGTLTGRLEPTKTVEMEITLTPNATKIEGNVLENMYANFKIEINCKQHNI